MQDKRFLSVVQFVLYYAKKYQKILIIQSILCLFWSGKEALFPYFVKNMVNIVDRNPLNHHMISSLYEQTFYLFGVWFLMELSMRLQGWFAFHCFPNIRRDAREFMYQAALQLPFSVVQKQSTGDVAGKISNMPSAVEALIEIVWIHLVSIGGAMCIGSYLLYSVHPQFACLFLVWLCLHLAVNFLFASNCHTYSQKHADSVTRLSGYFVDVLRNLFTVKMLNSFKHEIDYFRAFNAKEAQAAKKTRKKIEYVKLLQSILTLFFIAIVLTQLMKLGAKGMITSGDFAMIPILCFNLIGMTWWIGYQTNLIYHNVGIIQSGIAFFSVKEAVFLRHSRPASTDCVLECQDLHYSHDKRLWNIENIGFQAKKGEFIGILGASGAGKSTLAQLLAGILIPNQGDVWVDGQSIFSIPQQKRSDYIMLVPQEEPVFNRSIIDNICYGAVKTSLEDVKYAAKIAMIHDFIIQLPDGYQSIVGENGCYLSGGQKQRILIARAMIHQAPVLILDESMSSLDPWNQKHVLTHLKQLSWLKLVILISHDLNLLKLVDRMIVVNQGKVLLDGSRSDIIQQPFIHDIIRDC